MHFQRWSSIEDLAGPQLRTKFGVIEVNLQQTFEIGSSMAPRPLT